MKWLDTFYLFLSSEFAPERKYPIVLNSCNKIDENFILYNTEQLSRISSLNYIKKMSKDPNCVDIWDYSKANIEILSKHGINAKYYPPILPETYLSKLREFRNAGQTYDIGFSGADSPRRSKIIKDLQNAGLTTNFIKVYGDERDREIAKCKVLLNIHHSLDYKIFEKARCEPWLAIGVPIISEHSLDDDPRCINVSYDEMVDKTKEYVLNNKQPTIKGA